MNSNRRDFFLKSPICLAGALEIFAGETEFAFAQSSSSRSPSVSDKAAMNFWTKGMGLPPSLLPSAGDIAGGSKGANNTGPDSDFGREPIFLHYDETAGALVTTDQIDRKKMIASGDAQIDVQLQRLRLSGPDHATFAKYSSGAIYLEMQQKAPAAAAQPQGRMEEFIQLASTVFSAFTAGKPPAAGKGAAGAAHKSGFLQAGAASAKAGPAIGLQSPSQAQSLPLPKGAGKAAFSAFVKDPRRTAFGTFLAAMTTPDKSGAPAYAQLLSIPLTASPALAAIRAVVGNLQLQGSQQQTIMQSQPMDIAATVDALSNASSPYLPLSKGTYIVIRREHGPLISKNLSDFKMMEGYLVPKDVKSILDVTPDLVSQQIPGLTYLSLGVNVSPTKFNACSNTPVKA